MFAFTSDYRHTLEPSIQLFRSSRSTSKASTLRAGDLTISHTGEAPPPAYTPRVEPTSFGGSGRKDTSASQASAASSVSSGSSTWSRSSTRSKFARFNPFRRHQHRTSPSSPPSSSPIRLSSTSAPNLSTTTTSSSAAATRPVRPPRTVHFADPYDSDTSSVYSTDFPDSEHARSPPPHYTRAAIEPTRGGGSRRSSRKNSGHDQAGSSAAATTTSSSSRISHTHYSGLLTESSTYPAFLYIF